MPAVEALERRARTLGDVSYSGAVLTALRFVAEQEITGIPNVVVDGAPNLDTVLTLSHWPGSPTPVELRDDLSAQIAFRALAEPHRFEGIEAVTNNHFDQDGLTSAHALLNPQHALANRELLIDVARAGDFGTFRSREAARLAMLIAALDDDALSPLPTNDLAAPYPQRCGALYEWALPRVPELLKNLQQWQNLWADEDDHLTRSLQALADGSIQIKEHPELDLAVVEVRKAGSAEPVHRFTRGETATVHPMAINNATDRLRVLTADGNRYSLELRYESWVMVVSRLVMPRPDLRLLAEELNALEPTEGHWRADAPGALTPRLTMTGGTESNLSPAAVITTIRQFLATSPPAWDPFAAC